MAKGICAVYNCERPAWAASLCGRHYHRRRRYGTTTIWLPLATDAVVENIDFAAEGGHHIWRGTRTPRGYGTLGSRRAHRLVWELTRGPIPDGLWVLHHCDVTSCVNPEHLYIGDHAQNVADARARNRYRAPAKRNPRRGSNGPTAKLTEDLVLEIRRLYAGGARQVDLAEQFGVIQPTISQVVRRATWTHV